MHPDHYRLEDTGFGNLPLLEQLYASYCAQPSSVDSSWRPLFKQIQADLEPSLKEEGRIETAEMEPLTVKTVFVSGASDIRIYHLIEAYRTYGHLMADIDPIRTHDIKEPRELSLTTLGFSSEELSTLFPTCGLSEKTEAPLKEILSILKEIYCNKIGVEYMGLQRPDLEQWLQVHIERSRFKVELSMDQKQMILQQLNKSELFESFLHTKYVGQKRFSLEGGETLIPMLEAIVERGSQCGMKELYLGMAHRGRLNVLANILNKSYVDIFGEFEESYIPDSFEGSSDVKYHKGFSSTVTAPSGQQVNVVLAANPSHLESVDSVVEGQVRARQVMTGDDVHMSSIVPVLIHGDASISGQGVVYEVLQFYKLPGYGTGGTLHIVINNQIGFTTLPKDARSTHYCTDIARAFSAPVFHVNAEDPEGCVYATYLAMEIRQQFHCDVFIELNCYRKYGHNEGDEPAFTQPLEYQLISLKKPIRELYRDHLIQQGVLEKFMAETLEEEFKKALQHALKGVKITPVEKREKEASKGVLAPTSSSENLFEVVETAVPLKTLQEITKQSCHIPTGFNIHKKLEKLLEERMKMVQAGTDAKPVDWATAEMLAFGTLLWEGRHVRLSGQDSRRGTFSHRHGMWVDQVNAKKYFPLSHLKPDQARFDVFNSPLSEFGVLGFEFGYSLAYPGALVIWEAQFGDFCNGGQVIVDQFIATAEQKWGRKVGLTLFLPHGYEGQGPEHSSARIERFLGLSGNYNMLVVNATTPAQFFHLLRRQVKRTHIKPLIVFTPKGLLRHHDCVSSIKEFTTGSFQEILDDPTPPKKAKRLFFCSGRVFYDLIASRAKNQVDDMALIRIEQLYPLHLSKLKDLLSKYRGYSECYWVQEEPSNMGAWKFMRPLLKELMSNGMEPKYIGRMPSASPATGSHALHKKELGDLLNAVFKAEEQPFFEMSYDKTVRA